MNELTIEQQPVVKEIVTSKQPKEAGNDFLDQLERLGKLREQGVLTEEEFLEQKKRILA